MWVIITSLDPLRFYILRQAFARVASSPYSASTDFAADNCIHNTTPDSKKCDMSQQNIFEKHTSQRSFHRNITYSAPDLSQAASSDEKAKTEENFRTWNNKVWPAIEVAVTKSILMVWSKHMDMEKKSGASAFRRFQWLHFDVIVDGEGKPYVEEVNCNGFYVGDK